MENTRTIYKWSRGGRKQFCFSCWRALEGKKIRVKHLNSWGLEPANISPSQCISQKVLYIFYLIFFFFSKMVENRRSCVMTFWRPNWQGVNTLFSFFFFTTPHQVHTYSGSYFSFNDPPLLLLLLRSTSLQQLFFVSRYKKREK
jgi:hypothetical protein